MEQRQLSGLQRLVRLLGCLLLVAIVGLGNSRPTGAEEDAEALLAASANAMDEVQSFHFNWTLSTPEILFFDGLELTHAEGDVEQPSNLKVSIDGRMGLVPLSANAIVVGNDVWLAVSPLKDRYVKFEGNPVALVELVTAFDPAALIVKALENVDDPAITGTEVLDGEAMTVVEGTVNLSLFDFGTPIVDVAAKQVKVQIWVDQADLVHRIEVKDTILRTDLETLILQVDLSGFNEPVGIDEP